MDNGAALQESLATLTGQTTVPSVFIGEKHLGGKCHSGRGVFACSVVNTSVSAITVTATLFMTF